MRAQDLVIVAALIGLAFPISQAQQEEKAADVWTPFQFFVGRWEGRGEGQPGVSTGKQEFEFVLGEKFLLVRNESRFAPQEKNPKGEVHQDWGFFSFDAMRKKYVLRQFHVEGFVNQYVCDGPADGGKTFVFLSEAIENIPPGWTARLIYRILDENEFEQTFDLAAPGREMECYSRGLMKRADRRPPPAAKPKRPLRSSPPYTVSLELSAQSPFVPDGRTSLAELALTVVFSPVVFEFDADEDPLLGRSQVNTEKGKGTLSRLVLNDVQKGDERQSPAFLTARPRDFSAGLAIESEPTEEDEAASKSRNPPQKVRLSFWTEFGAPSVKWGSPLGGAELGDFRLVLDIPFRRLLEGRPYTATLPYEGRFPEDKGTWQIEFLPQGQERIAAIAPFINIPTISAAPRSFYQWPFSRVEKGVSHP